VRVLVLDMETMVMPMTGKASISQKRSNEYCLLRQ